MRLLDKINEDVVQISISEVEKPTHIRLTKNEYLELKRDCIDFLRIQGEDVDDITPLSIEEIIGVTIVIPIVNKYTSESYLLKGAKTWG